MRLIFSNSTILPLLMATTTLLGLASAFPRQILTRNGARAAFTTTNMLPLVEAMTPSWGTRRGRRSTTTKRMAGTTTADGVDKTPFPTWTFDKPCENMDWTGLPTPELSVVTSDDGSDLVIVGVFGSKDDDNDDDEKEDNPPPSLAGRVDDPTLAGALADLMEENAKTFKNGSVAGAMSPTLRLITAGSDGVGKTTRYVLLGLGSADKLLEEGTAVKLGSEIASKCNSEKKIASCAVLLPSQFGVSSEEVLLSDMSSAFYSTLYSDNRYRTGDKVKTSVEDLEKVSFVLPDSSSSFDLAISRGRALTKGLYLTKDIVNAPHNVMHSESLANTARRIADESGGTITCKILGKEECEERGMGAYLGVARGSETDPQFIHLTYKGAGEIKKRVGIVGKGLLFDTGGYNIKVQMMQLMKFDCGGAAAVLGAARAVGELAPEGVEAHFVVAACENMINERAMVPSDVLTASNGKTIEVVNTDAEGRLTLADALVYADEELHCESIIELSTLTGAVMVSLGKGMCGVWTADDDLAEELAAVSKHTGDKSWRMPLEKSYNKQLDSKIADMTNCGTPYGGAITAALFLQNFVSDKVPFAHIDIAGPVWDDEKGATGFGTKMVVEWVKRQGQ